MKDEWDALKDRARDCWVLSTLWTAENGKPIDIHDNHDPETGDIFPEYIPSGKPWKTHGVCDAVSVPYFTTDRNACALVLDEIRGKRHVWDKFCWYLLIHLYDGTTGLPSVEYGEKGFKDLCVVDAGGFMDKLLRADPDTICYCAVKAVKDQKEERSGEVLVDREKLEEIQAMLSDLAEATSRDDVLAILTWLAALLKTEHNDG